MTDQPQHQQPPAPLSDSPSRLRARTSYIAESDYRNRRGRPRRTGERRQQMTISLTDREGYILDAIAEIESGHRMRRIYKGELFAVLAFRTYPELWAQLNAEFNRELEGRLPLPKSEEEHQAAAAQQEIERQAYLRENGLPDMEEFERKMTALGLGKQSG